MPPILAVTGLRAEARIAAGLGVKALSGGGDPLRLALLLQNALASGACAVISFGIAGGLAPGLPAGTVIIADRVDEGESRWMTDVFWTTRLRDVLPDARGGALAAVDRAVAGTGGKADLHRRTGAVAVDMESHIAARLAAQHDVPFAALRVIADPAERSLPQAALVGMRPDGSTDVMAVLRALADTPTELPALIRTALDARAAFASLARNRRLLSAPLGYGDRVNGQGRDADLVPARPADLLALAEGAPERS